MLYLVGVVLVETEGLIGRDADPKPLEGSRSADDRIRSRSFTGRVMATRIREIDPAEAGTLSQNASATAPEGILTVNKIKEFYFLFVR